MSSECNLDYNLTETFFELHVFQDFVKKLETLRTSGRFFTDLFEALTREA